MCSSSVARQNCLRRSRLLRPHWIEPLVVGHILLADVHASRGRMSPSWHCRASCSTSACAGWDNPSDLQTRRESEQLRSSTLARTLDVHCRWRCRANLLPGALCIIAAVTTFQSPSSKMRSELIACNGLKGSDSSTGTSHSSTRRLIDLLKVTADLPVGLRAHGADIHLGRPALVPESFGGSSSRPSRPWLEEVCRPPAATTPEDRQTSATSRRKVCSSCEAAGHCQQPLSPSPR
mmetsp:Transcript_102141/g.327627  ORF Transcript_102141/g.327627 Transcript_102141/m.327627 type:complete len:235 (-) Transcript_102141:1871-2575(-)